MREVVEYTLTVRYFRKCPEDLPRWEFDQRIRPFAKALFHEADLQVGHLAAEFSSATRAAPSAIHEQEQS